MPKVPIILYYFSCLSVLVPIFLLLNKKQTFKITLISAFGILLFVSGFSDLISYILDKKYKIKYSGPIINNIYTLFEFFILSYIYCLLFNNKKIVYITSVIFIVFFILNTLFVQPFTGFQNWPVLLESIIFIFFSIKLYRQLLNNTSDLLVLPSFWLNTGVYLYFSLDLFVFAITNYVYENMSQEIHDTAWGFHNFINTIKNILFAIGIYFVNVQQEKKNNK